MHCFGKEKRCFSPGGVCCCSARKRDELASRAACLGSEWCPRRTGQPSAEPTSHVQTARERSLGGRQGQTGPKQTLGRPETNSRPRQDPAVKWREFTSRTFLFGRVQNIGPSSFFLSQNVFAVLILKWM